MNISVAVSHRDDEQGLWFTFHGLLGELQDFDWEFVAVNNSPEKSKASLKLLSHPRFRRLDYYSVLSPAAGKDAAIRACDNEYVLLCDSHVLFTRDSVKELVRCLDRNPKAMMAYPSCCYESRGLETSGFVVDWDNNFWKKGAYDHRRPGQRIAMAGHGAVLIRKSMYKSIGGYPAWQLGWGGEETFLSMKSWMFGYESWYVSEARHYHYDLDRSKPWYPDKDGKIDLAYNLTEVAFILGGVVAAKQVQEYYGLNYTPSAKAQHERQFVLDGAKIKNMQELKKHFDNTGVLN